jgi:hypothetical protein
MITPFTTRVLNCARCGEDHWLVEFNAFVRPPADATHWGTCPTTKDPILLVMRQAASVGESAAERAKIGQGG